MSGCTFCTSFDRNVPILDKYDVKVDVHVDHHGTFMYVWLNNKIKTGTNINYCPMCSKRLKEYLEQ